MGVLMLMLRSSHPPTNRTVVCIYETTMQVPIPTGRHGCRSPPVWGGCPVLALAVGSEGRWQVLDIVEEH